MKALKYYVPPAAWMAVIFIFSTSLFSGEETAKVLEPIVRFIFPEAPTSLVEILHHIVRKTAHLTEYAVLYLLLYRAFVKGAGLTPAKAALKAFAVSAMYAVTDEFHQSLVPGRTASPIDVLIDSSGAALGLLIRSVIIKKRNLSAAPFIPSEH